MLQDDGDIIRGLGLVTLYSAYLEEQIDNLCAMLGYIEEFGKNKVRWPISRKIKHAKKLLSKLDGTEIKNLITDLDTCTALFEDRNELVHGRIYGGTFDRPDTLKSARPNIPDREVDSAELYKLANNFDEFRAVIYRPTILKLPRAINTYLNQNLTKPKTEN
jgi:hypothetical protein